MGGRTIYEGSIEVDGSDYVHAVLENGEYVDVEIEALDDLVTQSSSLSFQLDYPFERPYDGTVVGDAGITLRQIIDAIRLGFRRMYRGATEEDVPGLVNKRVRGEYGEALHVIADLVVEEIVLFDDDGHLSIGIGS